MSDFEAQGPVVVWGITVPRKANGRHMWPEDLKAEAARRVMAGATVAAIARDISANESRSFSSCRFGKVTVRPDCPAAW